MFDLSKLPASVTNIVGLVVVPVTMVWLIVRWFRLVPKDGKYTRAIRANNNGCAFGIVFVALLVTGFHYYNPDPCVSQVLSKLSFGIAVATGAVAGILLRLTPKPVPDAAMKPPATNSAIEAPVGDAEKKRTAVKAATIKSRLYGFAAATAICMGLAAILFYYCYSGNCLIHHWLMFAVMTMLCVYRLALVGVGE